MRALGDLRKALGALRRARGALRRVPGPFPALPGAAGRRGGRCLARRWGRAALPRPSPAKRSPSPLPVPGPPRSAPGRDWSWAGPAPPAAAARCKEVGEKEEGRRRGGIRPRRAEPGLGGSQQLAAGTPPPRPRRSSAAPLRVGFWGRGGSGLEAGREAPHAPPRSLPAMAAAGAAEGPLAARRAGAARRGKAPPRPVPLGSSRPLGLLGFYFSPSG